MQRNNEDQFWSLRTKNKKIWRKNIINFHKKEKGQTNLLYEMKVLQELHTRNNASLRNE